jgi:hypothetical protein
MLKFENQYDKNFPKITIELSSDSSLSEVLQAFQTFLKGCGYVFDGEIIIEGVDHE